MGTIEQDIEKLARDTGIDMEGFSDRARLADTPASDDLAQNRHNSYVSLNLAATAIQEYLEDRGRHWVPLSKGWA